MATGTGKVYTKAISRAFNGEINYSTDTIKVALVTSTYTPDQNAHDYFNDITNELSTANGYTAGGATLASKTVTDGTLSVVFDGADTVWTASGGPIGACRYAIIYKDTGTASTSPLISYVDFGSDQTATDGNTFTIAWDATNGVVKATIS